MAKNNVLDTINIIYTNQLIVYKQIMCVNPFKKLVQGIMLFNVVQTLAFCT